MPLSVSPHLRRLLIALAVMAIIAVRKHDSFSNPQLWAEDGNVFLREGELSGWKVLFKPYEGYLHLLPRLVAATGRSLPMGIIPTFYASAALLAAGLIAWTIQSPRVRIPAAWAGALAIAIIPHNGEVYLTIVNLQWVTAVGLFTLAAMEDAVTAAQRTGDVALLVLTGLTGPFIILVLPLLAWRAWRRRSKWSYVLLGVALACVAAHLPSLLHRPKADIPQAWSLIRHASIIGRRLWISLFAGEIALAPAIAAALTFAAALGLGWILWRRRAALSDTWMLFMAALVIVAATGFKARIDTWNYDDLVSADRYFFTAKIFDLWLLAAIAATFRGIWKPVVSGLVLAAPVVFNRAHFLFPPSPPQNWSRSAREIETGHPTRVPVLPEGFQFAHPGRRPSQPHRP